MSKPRKIEALENLARTMVGDGRNPDLFFVTDQGVVVTITRDKDVAYDHWRQLAARSPRLECALENRQFGVLASVEPSGTDENKLIVRFDNIHLSARGF
jgi:hypothetical protein